MWWPGGIGPPMLLKTNTRPLHCTDPPKSSKILLEGLNDTVRIITHAQTEIQGKAGDNSQFLLKHAGNVIGAPKIVSSEGCRC